MSLPLGLLTSYKDYESGGFRCHQWERAWKKATLSLRKAANGEVKVGKRDKDET